MRSGTLSLGDEPRLLPGQLYLDSVGRPCVCLRGDSDTVEGLSLQDGTHPVSCGRNELSGLPDAARAGWGRVALRYYTQIAPLFDDAYHAYPFAGGLIYLNVRESHMMLARVLGLYEPVKTRRIMERLGPGMTFADVGSNKGDFALIAAARVATGRVLAFEPEPGNAEWVGKSVALNNYSNVEVMQYALGDEDADAALYLGEKSGWHTLLPNCPARDKGVIQVRQRRLDTVLQETGISAIDVVKIDVEGAELEVLRGAAQCLSDHRVSTLFIDVHPHLGADPLAVRDQLELHGYRVTALKPGGEPDVAVHPETAELIAAVFPE